MSEASDFILVAILATVALTGLGIGWSLSAICLWRTAGEMARIREAMTPGERETRFDDVDIDDLAGGDVDIVEAASEAANARGRRS